MLWVFRVCWGSPWRLHTPWNSNCTISHTENAQIWSQRLKETTWSQINTFFTTESTHETAECTFSSECCSGVRSQSKQCWLCINMDEVCCQKRWHVVLTFSSWGRTFLANTDTMVRLYLTVWGIVSQNENNAFWRKDARFSRPLTSFPVDMTATTGNFWTSTSVTPTVARRPISDGPMWVPFASTHSPRLMSWPMGLWKEGSEEKKERKKDNNAKRCTVQFKCVCSSLYTVRSKV